ncbi:MAG TPA: hypothetical protein VF424_01120, partial [Vicinamibacterales bacterium]
MLQAAVRVDDDAVTETKSPTGTAAAPIEPIYVVRGARYGETRRFSVQAVALTAAIHALLLGGLLGLQ